MVQNLAVSETQVKPQLRLEKLIWKVHFIKGSILILLKSSCSRECDIDSILNCAMCMVQNPPSFVVCLDFRLCAWDPDSKHAAD